MIKKGYGIRVNVIGTKSITICEHIEVLGYELPELWEEDMERVDIKCRICNRHFIIPVIKSY